MYSPNLPTLSGKELMDITLLVKKGAVVKCQACHYEFWSSYFLVGKSNDEKRFILNLKKLNAYFTIPVALKYRKYLRFSFHGVFYEFTCLPFGLCTSPFVFTKIMKPVAQFLR